MRYREGGDIDLSSVQDRRGGGGFGGGRGIAVGGGGLGLVGLVVVVLIQVLGGGGGGTGSSFGGLSGLGAGETADNSQLEAKCRDSGAANNSVDCAVAADIDSIQDYWTQTLGNRYTPTDTVFFSGSVQTSCGGATSGSGPFYCPADQLVYIDLSFFDELRQQFGAQGGLFVDAYVIANHAETVPDESGAPLIAEITQDDINRALDAAGRIGDDFIQENLGNGRVDQNAFTHGSSEQRQKWFSTGYQTGDPSRCDTFATDDLG
ncbi:MAG: neutral zinc metallopeptidase [Geodermatophilales bacterium]|nr:neutral zinc metallopeptidase [Geodermatophilales bacterium]